MQTSSRALYDLASWKNGLAFKNIHFSQTGMPIIKIAELKNGITKQTQFTEQEFDESVFLHKGDMLFSWSGNPETSIDVFWYNLPDGWLNQHIFKVTPAEDVDELYLYYLLKRLKPKFQAIASNKQTTGLGHVTVKDLKEIITELPPLDVQKKIGSYLYAFDGQIDCLERINENLFKQAMSLFSETFLSDDNIGKRKALYDYADYINGAAFKPTDFSETGLPIIKITELKNGLSSSTQHFNGNKGDKYLIHNKDILFSWSGNPDTSIDIFIWCLGDAILNQHTFNVKSKDGAKWFTFLLLKYFKPQFMQIASNKQTTGLGHVTATDLKELTFPYDHKRVIEFEKAITPFMESVYNNMLEKQNLLALRDAMLPKLVCSEGQGIKVLIG